jgi:hypothetical protein
MERKHKSTLDDLKAGKYSDDITNVLETAAKDLVKKYS